MTAPIKLTPGEQVRFASDRRWWDVRAADDHFAVLTRQADFQPLGKKYYTITDNERGVRGPANTIGQGWDEHMGQEACDALLKSLRGEGDHTFEVSYRNNLPLDIISQRGGSKKELR